MYTVIHFLIFVDFIEYELKLVSIIIQSNYINITKLILDKKL